MSFLLDTNVIAEWSKPRPDAHVVRWLADADEDDLFLSVVTLAELRYGIERLPAGARRRRLESWLAGDLPSRFETRHLPVDERVSEEWGRVVARRDSLGRPIGVLDAFLAATANVHDLTFATRNVSDFEGSIASIVNPWNEHA